MLATVGMLAMRDLYDRLHFLAPSALGSAPITAAVLVREGPSTIGLKAILLVAFTLASSPLLAHVIARTARIQERGDWRPGPDEGIEVEER